MQDKVMPNGKWVFDSEVTKCFSDMLARSIPDYKTMRDLCFAIGMNFVCTNGNIIDLGCSNGLSAERFINHFPDNNFYLYDVSAPMLEACREKYNGYQNVIIENRDIVQDFPDVQANLILSVLTLQFTPIEHRQMILQKIYNQLLNGGAFILVEKLLGANAVTNRLLVEQYYIEKRINGYTLEQIERKRKSLEGVLVPVTYDFNIEFLKQAGFKYIDCFWRNLNFAAFLAIKD